MLKRRYISLDCSASSAAGTIKAPIGRLAAVYYDFSDAGMTGNLTITALGSQVFSKTGADDNDGVQQVTDPPIVADDMAVELASISGASPGDKCNISIFIDE